MELVKPAIGLVFWMIVSFSIILFILRKFAWKPVLNMIKERENSIEDAIQSAEKARKEMKDLQASNEKILAEARLEKDNMMKEARDAKESILNEAKAKAKEEADRIISSARETIQNEKNAAVTELKNQVALLSIEIAEKILKQNLSGDEKQKELVNTLMKDIKLN